MNKYCVYKITNKLNEKFYIGSTIHGLAHRKRNHLNKLKKNKHHNYNLQREFNEYGEAAFIFSIIDVLDDSENPTEILAKEQMWIDNLNPHYNILRKDIMSHIGVKRREETCKKISKSLIGRKLSHEHIEKMRKSLTGKKQNKEQILKRIKSMKNSESWQLAVKSKKRSDLIKSSRMKNGGYIVSNEQKKKISDGLKSKNLQSAISIIIQKFDLNGIFLCEYPSFNKAERENNLCRGSLSYNVKKLNKKIYHGHVWKILDIK